MTGLDEQDARALTYLAGRIRRETYGCGPWDEHGTFINVMKRQGQNLAIVAQDVIGHAARPDAKTPGVIAASFKPPAVTEQKPTPTGGRLVDQCRDCFKALDRCVCPDGPTTRPQPAADGSKQANQIRTRLGWRREVEL